MFDAFEIPLDDIRFAFCSPLAEMMSDWLTNRDIMFELVRNVNGYISAADAERTLMASLIGKDNRPDHNHLLKT